MGYLLFVSLLWAFSFGLIKTNLSSINPVLVTLIRLGFSLAIFLPLLKLKKLTQPLWVKFGWIGMIQFGLMYIFYNYAFRYLKAYEVALFTIFTPIFVVLFNSILQKKFNWIFGLSAVLAVVGTAIVVQIGFNRPDMMTGFILVQASNLCFAIGQVLYKRQISILQGVSDQSVFAVLYAGGVLAALIASVFTVDWTTVAISTVQWTTLVYLGMISSGLGFFMWNYGARRTNIGTLAVFNNLKIPLSITVSLLVFGEKAGVSNLLIGGGIVLLALLISEGFEWKNRSKQAVQSPIINT